MYRSPLDKNHATMNRYLKASKLFLVLFTCCSLLMSCAQEEGEGGGAPATPTLTINKEYYDYKADYRTGSIPITTNISQIKVESDKSWCRAKYENQRINLSLDPNPDFEMRMATLTVTGGEFKKKVQVRQLGEKPQILVDQASYDVGAAGAGLDFVVTANVEVEVKHPDWISKPSEARAAELRKLPFSYVANPNKAEEGRVGQIVVSSKTNDKSGNTPSAVTIVVKQKGLSAYAPASSESIIEDFKLKIASGTDTSHQIVGDAEGGISKAFDGDYNTMYHSAYNNSGDNYFPITLTMTLEKASDVDYLIYHPRKSGDNGHFKEVEISYTTDGTNYTTIKTHDFGGVGTPTRISFDQPLKNVKTFKFVVKSGHGNGKGFAAASEIEFYQRNPKKFDYKTLFKDEVCSELKDNITEQEIYACPDEFFRNLAYYIHQKKYSTEFRVADYKAWPHPNIQSTAHKTNPYSLLDNPTGISVKAGEDLVVLVGDTHGYNQLSIRVQNLDKPNGDGFGGDTYPLSRGVNKLKMAHSGLVYVMYHLNKLEVEHEQPIKIHFASGSVNGYYDDQKHKGRWNELINKATDKYFDVLGKYVHMTFPVESYKRWVPNGESLIDRYDKIVNAEMLLLGLYKPNNKPFKNRMYMHAMYRSYMYATWYHTAYNISPDRDGKRSVEEAVLDVTKWGLWGPAHEIGHMNQTRPGVLWRGMTECTVNIKSAYVQTTIFGQPCRLQIENMDGNRPHNRYTKAWNEIVVPEKPHAYTKYTLVSAHVNADPSKGIEEKPAMFKLADNRVVPSNQVPKSDVFCQLVPFWQLELYFGKVLGMTPSLDGSKKDGFYPNLYEYYRNHNSAADAENGHHQTEFAYVASKISGYDLTDFFTKWGFLREVDTDVDDYSLQHLQVTKARIDEVKNKIKGENLQSLGNIPIEYITDNTVDLFKSKATVVAGMVSVSGNTLTLGGWQNAVAFEVRDKSTNKVVYVGDGYVPEGNSVKKLYLPSAISWSSGKYKVVGVSATGDRVDAKN